MTPRLPFNKVAEFEDFADPEMIALMRDLCGYKIPHLGLDYPTGYEHRKDWEVAMAVRSLKEFGALRSDARILGVGAGTEDTVFWLTNHVDQVFATDRYLEPGAWKPLAPMSMLVEPEVVATQAFDANRLVAQHMDGRALRYPDNMFDGIFSSGSIEHFGDLEDVANAAYEMGRVLKPGGVLALSTEFRIAGPPGGRGWPGLTLLLSLENLQRYIVDASGLQLADRLRTDVSEATLATPRDLHQVVTSHLERMTEGYTAEYTGWDFPHLILVSGGYVFGSVHLTLLKGDTHPSVPNTWAKPSAATIQAISEFNRSILVAGSTEAAPAPAPVPAGAVAVAPPAPPAPAGPPLTPWEATAEAVRVNKVVIENAELAVANRLPLVEATLAELDAALFEIDDRRLLVDERLATIAGVQAEREHRAGADEGAGADPTLVRSSIAGTRPGWVCQEISPPRGFVFSVIVDTNVYDTVSQYLATGVTIDELYLDLMLQLIHPGDLVVDLGAHVGTFSLAAAAIGCRVVAVEAAPGNVELLRASAARNGHHALRVVHAAASDEPGTVEFWPRGPWGRVATAEADAADQPSITVAAITVQDLLTELDVGPPSFVKIDVEGSEVKALRGMADLLSLPWLPPLESAPPILFESNGHTLAFYGESPATLLAAVEDLGYTSYLITGDRRLIRTRADEMQPQTLVDYLAVKRVPVGLDGWRVEQSMRPDERVARIVEDLGHVNPHHRAHMARTLATCEDGTVSHTDVAQALDALTRDPIDDVRAAADWFRAGAPVAAGASRARRR